MNIFNSTYEKIKEKLRIKEEVDCPKKQEENKGNFNTELNQRLVNQINNYDTNSDMERFRDHWQNELQRRNLQAQRELLQAQRQLEINKIRQQTQTERDFQKMYERHKSFDPDDFINYFILYGFEEENGAYVKDDIIFYEKEDCYLSLSHDKKIKYPYELKYFMQEEYL